MKVSAIYLQVHQVSLSKDEKDGYIVSPAATCNENGIIQCSEEPTTPEDPHDQRPPATNYISVSLFFYTLYD